ncbi:hypothetical protein BCV72DRAFT_330845 [Rhizopus microsporus var. microsporus]|uniref:Reverse transcriptase zinc-binding domain-containing protein n=1 Tax=Rhizopus microsporus var. microsporus TaxID=86635 RepID=A0A1X0R0N3_RHIZD|nr:hypothetical protein BCV72DRAFT_330845 [Rhizopus microsporus var. microsporus]
MPLEASSLWFRLVHGKLHCQRTITKLSSRSQSEYCIFCLVSTEGLHRLFVLCPKKWDI